MRTGGPRVRRVRAPRGARGPTYGYLKPVTPEAYPASVQRNGRAVALGPWPVEAPVVLGDRHVVDARLPASRQAVVVELPVLIAVGAPPAAVRVVPFVLEAYGDAVAGERPEILAQDVVELPLPLANEEGAN